MSPKVKENVEITWRVVALGLLSVCVYFLVDIKSKVDQAHKAALEQPAITARVLTLENQVDRLGLSLADIREKHYKLESRQ